MMTKKQLMNQNGIVEVETRKPEEFGDYKQKVYGIRHYKNSEVVEQLSHSGLEFTLDDIDREIENLQRKREHYQKAKDSLEEIIKLEPEIKTVEEIEKEEKKDK